MSFDAMSESDYKNVSIGIYGKKKVSTDLVQKIQESMERRLMEFREKQIADKLQKAQFLQPQELSFLKDLRRGHVDMTLSLPSFIQDPMHFCVIARQLFLGSPVFIAPLSSYNMERREKKTEEEREKKSTEERERDFNRIQISSISHPSCLGYNLYDIDNHSESRRNKAKSDVKLNADFRPRLKRNKHVDSVWGDPKKCHPVFFESVLSGSASRRQFEGRLVLWNQNEFTFLYEGLEKNKIKNPMKKKLVNEIGVGLSLIEFSIIQDTFDSPLPSSTHFICSTSSVDRDVKDFDTYSLDALAGMFSEGVTSNSTVIDESSALENRVGLKLCMYPTVKMLTKGLSDHCISLFNDAVKIYLFERCCLLHRLRILSPISLPITSQSTLESSSRFQDALSSHSRDVNDVDSINSTILINRLNKILRGTGAGDHAGHHFYAMKLPKKAALDLHQEIVSKFLSENESLIHSLSNLSINPCDFSFTDGVQRWCEVYKSEETYVNVSIFSDVFGGDCSSVDEKRNLVVRPEEFSGTIAQLLPTHLRRKRFMLEIITTSVGLHLFHYGLPQYFVSLGNMIEDLTQSVSDQNSHIWETLGLSQLMPVEDKSIPILQLQNEDEHGDARFPLSYFSWPKKRLSRLLPRESEPKVVATSSLSTIPLHAWNRGILMKSNITPLPIMTGESSNPGEDKFEHVSEWVRKMCDSLSDVELVIYPGSMIILEIVPFSSSIHTFHVKPITSRRSVEILHRISDSFDVLSCLTSATERDTWYNIMKKHGHHNLCNHRHISCTSLSEFSYFSDLFEGRSIKCIQYFLQSFPLGIFFDNILRSRRDCEPHCLSKIARFQELIRYEGQ